MHGRGWRAGSRGLACALALACACACACACAANAQGIESIDPSARAGGMGGAAVAVGGAGTRDLWLNPALLATSRGLSVQASSQQLLPGFVNDLRHQSTGFGVCFAGLALGTSGRPFGGTTLVLPTTSTRSDSFGNFSGVGWEELVESRSAALSLAGLADALWALTGHPGAPFTRRADVAWGRQWKRVSSNAFFGETHFSARDEGWYVRAVPLDSRRGSGLANGGLRVELSWGVSSQNQQPSPSWGLAGGGVPRYERKGGAMRATWWGPQRAGEPGNAWTDGFRGAFSPLLDLTLAYDHEWADPRYAPRRPDPTFGAPWKVEHYGAEATFSRIVTARFGYVFDASGEIRKPSWGLGARLPLGSGGEIRYDFAGVPQSYERRVYRHQVSLRIDQLARAIASPGVAEN